MSYFEQESNKNFNIVIITMFISLYLFIGVIVSSYLGERYNKQITIKEYINITVNLPIFLFANIYNKINEEFKDTTPVLDRCLIRCKSK